MIPKTSRMGVTRSRANSRSNLGLKFHATTPIGLARPTLEGMDYRADPISEEGVTLFSFGSKADYDRFLAVYGGQGAQPLV
jgi:hypothetical protein